MRGLKNVASLPRTKAVKQPPSGPSRDHIARQLALLTIGCLTAIFLVSSGTQFLMPGPLTSAHSSIESCSSCHARAGTGKFSWVAGLAASNPHDDSKACLTCHVMPDTAFNAHGASPAILQQSTTRLVKIAAETYQPLSAQAQEAAFPTHDMVAAGLQCATCHQEHQGANFNLKEISNEQCRSCHAVKFDSFDGAHPVFESYPFKRRTRIIFDHAGHFGKHYPELAKKEPGKTLPATCSTCHDSSASRTVMAVAPFEKTCSTCHLDQITGKERASGPKGIAFLSLPGIDVQSLRKKGAQIGEWPEDSEAALTPFMKVMIGRSSSGAALIQSLQGVTLQDLSAANDEQIKTVTSLVWEIKKLFHAMMSGKASDILANLTIGGSTKLSPGTIADLTANLPRDVIASAQQQWLPNLAKEIAARPDTGERQRSGWNTHPVNHKSAVLAFMRSQPAVAHLRPLQFAQAGGNNFSDGDTAMPRRPLPSGTPRSIEQLDQEIGATPPPSAKIKSSAPPEEPAPNASNATGSDAAPSGDTGTSPTTAASPSDPANQTDELLAPTEAELREIKAREKGAPPQKTAAPAATENPASSDEKPAATPPSATATAAPPSSSAPTTASNPDQTTAQTENAVDNSFDAESWADTGGWYRQDHAIFYRPAGHTDKFLASWLLLTSPVAAKGATGAEAAVFEQLIAKDAQGSCTKCHSVDDIAGQGRAVNFTPLSAKSKAGQFTRFAHEPHFGLMGDRGCSGCHEMQKNTPPIKTYEQGDPKIFASNFGAVKKEVCQTCHATNAARQDCTLCHAYHVNGVSTPIMKTKIPTP